MARHYTRGQVACSKRVNQASACSRESPHISAEGFNPPQNAGRAGVPNTLQRNASSSCTHGTPAGLPCGMPGSGEVMEGAIQQAAQEGRQIMEKKRKENNSSPVYNDAMHQAPGKYGDKLSARIPSA